MALVVVDPIPEPQILPKRRRRLFRFRVTARGLRNGLLAMAIGSALYWGGGALLLHRVDDDLSYRPASLPTGGSSAVAMAAGLIEREVDAHAWTPNDPWFAPNALLDNMTNYQQGMLKAIGRFSFEMLDQMARTRGSSSNDPDLARAAGYLQFPADVWVFDLEKSWLPTVPSEDQYRAGQRALLRYNDRLADGRAIFQERADAFAGALQRISADLSSQTAQLDRARDTGWWVFSAYADDVFYENKGMLYAYAMLLSALGEDVDGLIAERGLAVMWAQMIDSLEHAAALHPLVVLNAGSDSSIFANHLLLQGFYMKRAILQLEEIVNVLAI